MPEFLCASACVHLRLIISTLCELSIFSVTLNVLTPADELRAADAGQQVVLMGWVNRRRDLGNLIFIDLRDRTGITQVVFNAEQNTGAA